MTLETINNVSLRKSLIPGSRWTHTYVLADCFLNDFLRGKGLADVDNRRKFMQDVRCLTESFPFQPSEGFLQFLMYYAQLKQCRDHKACQASFKWCWCVIEHNVSKLPHRQTLSQVSTVTSAVKKYYVNKNEKFKNNEQTRTNPLNKK